MTLVILGIVIGCVGILVTVIVAMKRSAGIRQSQQSTQQSSQNASLEITEVKGK